VDNSALKGQNVTAKILRFCVQNSALKGRHVTAKGNALEREAPRFSPSPEGAECFEMFGITLGYRIDAAPSGLAQNRRAQNFPGRCPSLLHGAPLGLDDG
jgi:hypothetical protein